MKDLPYNILLITAIAILIAGYILFGSSSLDIHLHDTYFVISAIYYAWLLAIILFFVWLLYMITKNVLYSKKLSWVHILLTASAFVFTALLPYIENNFNQGLAEMPGRYYDYRSFNNFNVSGRFTPMVIMAFIGLFVAQLLYLVNLCIGLYKRFI